MPIYCTHCGAALTPGSAFCSACGQPVAPAPAQAAPPNSPSPPQAPYGQPPPPQAPYGQPPYGQETPGQWPPAVGNLLQNAPAMGQRLQSLPFLASLPLGMRLPALGVAALLALLLLSKVFSHGSGANAPGGGGGNAPAAQAGVFSGVCTTEAGKPLANVDIQVQGVTSAGVNTEQDAHSDASGAYSVSMPPGKYSVENAWYPVALGTTNYTLPLATTDGETNDPADIGPGVVRNLVLHIHGKIAPNLPDNDVNSFYGGYIRVDGQNGVQFPAGDVLELTLVPETPLLDGTTSPTLVLRQTCVHGTADDAPWFEDVPLGQYTATLRLVGADGGTLMNFRMVPTNGAENPTDAEYKTPYPGFHFDPGPGGLRTNQCNLYVANAI